MRLRALLAMIAQEEGQNLTALYRQIGRSPGATRDYLGWLLGVDAVRMVKKRYYYVDGSSFWPRAPRGLAQEKQVSEPSRFSARHAGQTMS